VGGEVLTRLVHHFTESYTARFARRFRFTLSLRLREACARLTFERLDTLRLERLLFGLVFFGIASLLTVIDDYPNSLSRWADTASI
jgi:hypothetical protein